jgi:hypothetical protein
MKNTTEEIKNWVARDMGYPNWNEYFNWVARNDEKPSVIAQQIESAMQKVSDKLVEQNNFYHPKFIKWIKGKYYEDAGGFRDINATGTTREINMRFTREFIYKIWLNS